MCLEGSFNYFQFNMQETSGRISFIEENSLLSDKVSCCDGE